MKKLRMIVTTVIVLAIVGSALALNAKQAAWFCYSTLGTSTCDAITCRTIDPEHGTTIHYYPNWNGLTSECIALGNQRCTSTVKVIKCE